MSGAATAAWVSAAVAGVSAVASHQQAKKQESQQKKAQQQAQVQAQKQEKQAERDFNRQNQKKPDLAKIMEGNAKAGQAGSTMLTGPSGVDGNSLALGRNTLLGG
jgi:23S rRNA pseudoU1915 N3-methylase RlmH